MSGDDSGDLAISGNDSGISSSRDLPGSCGGILLFSGDSDHVCGLCLQFVERGSRVNNFAVDSDRNWVSGFIFCCVGSDCIFHGLHSKEKFQSIRLVPDYSGTDPSAVVRNRLFIEINGKNPGLSLYFTERELNYSFIVICPGSSEDRATAF